MKENWGKTGRGQEKRDVGYRRGGFLDFSRLDLGKTRTLRRSSFGQRRKDESHVAEGAA